MVRERVRFVYLGEIGAAKRGWVLGRPEGRAEIRLTKYRVSLRRIMVCYFDG